jgi:hypothetical protein
LIRISTLLVLAALGARQGVFTYADRAGNMSAHAKNAKALQLPGPVYRFSLAGEVSVQSKSQGLQLRASKATINVRPTKVGGRNEIDSAVADGSVVIVRTSAAQVTTLQTNHATFARSGSAGTIDLSGSVTVTSKANGKYIVVTGSNGKVLLDMTPGATRPMKEASLSGGVHTTLVQSDGSKLDATGQRLTLNNTTATLSGHVAIKGVGASSLGTIQNVSRAVLNLNEKGEVTSFEVG